MPARSIDHAAGARRLKLDFDSAHCAWEPVPRSGMHWVIRLMNYQHAFHAGNFADVHKHVVLSRILDHLRQKACRLSRHRYAMRAPAATICSGRKRLRAREWRGGIGRVFDGIRQLRIHKKCRKKMVRKHCLRLICDVVAALNPGGELRIYPGSPLVALSLLRRQDRLIACELEPRAAALLDGGAARRARAPRSSRSTAGWRSTPMCRRRNAAASFSSIRPMRKRPISCGCPTRFGRGAPQMADRHLYALVPDQGARRAGRAGAAAAQAGHAENFALRNHARRAARRHAAWSAPG